MINDQPISNPTFYQNIRPMFSQYDQVMMLSSGRIFDLFNYNSVKSMANQIYLAIQPNDDPNMANAGWSKLQQVHVMPAVGGPWPPAWIVTFKNWIDTGLPAGEDPSPGFPPIPATNLQAFIALSKALTGIENFFRFNASANPQLVQKQEEALATIYYNRLLQRPVATGSNDTLEAVLAAWTANPEADVIAATFPICKDIILIWYNTTTQWDFNGKPAPSGFYGTPQFNQYKEGQVWKVSLIHPIGYAPENTPFYWQNAPTADGENSGFYFVNY
jgi:hypothetical protein